MKDPEAPAAGCYRQTATSFEAGVALFLGVRALYALSWHPGLGRAETREKQWMAIGLSWLREHQDNQ